MVIQQETFFIDQACQALVTNLMNKLRKLSEPQKENENHKGEFQAAQCRDGELAILSSLSQQISLFLYLRHFFLSPKKTFLF